MVYISHTDDFAGGNAAGGASGHRALERAAETNHANGNRADLSGYPTIRETNIPPTVEYVTQLESLNGEQAGFSHVLMESGGRSSKYAVYSAFPGAMSSTARAKAFFSRPALSSIFRNATAI